MTNNLYIRNIKKFLIHFYYLFKPQIIHLNFFICKINKIKKFFLNRTLKTRNLIEK